MILEGRLAGWLANHDRIPAFKVWVVCDEDERIRRLVQRDGGDARDPGRARWRTASRGSGTATPGTTGPTSRDLSIYDLVSTRRRRRPDEVRDRVLEALDASEDVRLEPG